MNKLFKILLVICLGICLFIPKSFFVLAQDAENESLSIILALDSSGSMKQTDPEKLRIVAAKMFIELLSDEDEVGIIEFASDVKVVSPLVKLVSGKKQEVIKSLNTINLTGNTRIDLAVSKASQLLEKSSSKNKVIVLLSDGALDVDGSPESPKSLEALNFLKNKILPEKIITEKIKLYTISLQDKTVSKDTLASLNDLMEYLSINSSGLSYKADTPFDLHKCFISILDDILNLPKIHLEKKKDYLEFRVDPSIKRLNIVVDKKDSPDAKISIYNSKGQEITDLVESVKISKSQFTELISIKSIPEAGTWKLKSSKDLSKILVEIFANTDYRLKLEKINGKKETSEKLEIIANMLFRSTKNQDYSQVQPNNTKLYLEVENGSITKNIPLKTSSESYFVNYIPKKAGELKLKIFSIGDISRETSIYKINIAESPFKKPLITLDQLVYANGETVKLMAINHDKRIKLNKDTLRVVSSNLNKALPSKISGNNLYSKFYINQNYQLDDYKIILEYFDPLGNIGVAEAVVYVAGKIKIDNDVIDFGFLNNSFQAYSNIKITSDLDLSYLSTRLVVENFELEESNISSNDVYFLFDPKININGSEKIIDFGIKLNKESPIATLPQLHQGKLKLILYSEEDEVLDKKIILVKFWTLGLFSNVFAILTIIMFLLVTLGLVYKKISKR